MPPRERRIAHGEVRAVEEDGAHTILLHCIRPESVDDYGSLWDPHTFDESIEARMPTLVWSHDWAEPLGPGLDYKLSDDGPSIRFALDDFDAVPTARRAWVQTRSGTIRDCSVGFSDTQRRDPTDEERETYPGIREVIEKATLDEVSLVLRGAVPGAKVLAVRSTETVPKTVAATLIARMGAGEIDLADALTELKTYSSVTDNGDEPEPEPEPQPEPVPAAEAEQLEAEAAEAIEALDRHGISPEIRRFGLENMRAEAVAQLFDVRTAKAPHSTGVTEGTWDGNAAMTNAKSAADYWYICAWRDPNGDPEDRSSYKFPHHSRNGGPANLPGVRNALARLPQASIPDSDRAGVERHLRSHLNAQED
jgi:HK97 family phage prohead protease